MAYARRTRYPARRSTVRRTYRKSSYRRKPSYATRKRTYRKRPATKKRILNMTSAKKRDTMVHDNTTATPQVSSTLFPNQTNCIPFIASARAMNQADNKDYSRESQTVYVRGLADRFTVNTNDATAWEFRYVAFRYKGAVILSGFSPGTYVYNQNSNGGYNRVAGVYQPSSVASLITEMFKGANGVDWLSPQQASLDTSRISVVTDRKFSVKSGNENGTFVRKSFWIPYNANLVYGGDERGGKQVDDPLSTSGLAGKGDLYCIVFANAMGAPETTSRADILFDSTFYWHEK